MRSFLFAATLAVCLLPAARDAFAAPPSGAALPNAPRITSLLDASSDEPLYGSGLEGFLAVRQDVVTVEEYERLTGVHKRLGLGVFGGINILGGGSAGHGRVGSRTLTADFGDIWGAFGFGGGVDFTIMVMPLYNVHFGIGLDYHTGESSDDNTWTDLVALPFYLGVRINLPLGVSPDRWFDFENPDIAAESHGMIPIPYLKLKGIGYLMQEVFVDGWVVEPGKAAVGGDEEYFRRGIYGGAYAGFGIEARFSSVGFYGEVGFRYIWHPKLSLRFDELLTSGDFYEITAEFGLVYYFGSGRIIKIS